MSENTRTTRRTRDRRAARNAAETARRPSPAPAGGVVPEASPIRASGSVRSAGSALAAGLVAAWTLALAAPAEAQHGDGPPPTESAAQPTAAAQAPDAPDARETTEGAQDATLYQRLGGIYPIASVVDVFIDLLLHNDVVNENPAIREARDRVPAPGLKYHVTALVCQASGGPCGYTGRSMEEAHAHLNIGEREWEAMLSDLRRTLNDFQVPEEEQEELIAIVKTTKDDIVVED